MGGSLDFSSQHGELSWLYYPPVKVYIDVENLPQNSIIFRTSFPMVFSIGFPDLCKGLPGVSNTYLYIYNVGPPSYKMVYKAHEYYSYRYHKP